MWSRKKKEAKRCSCVAVHSWIAGLIRSVIMRRTDVSSLNGRTTEVFTPKSFEWKHTCSVYTYLCRVGAC